jgi:L,D-transpeptidase ErfK/SrfK
MIHHPAVTPPHRPRTKWLLTCAALLGFSSGQAEVYPLPAPEVDVVGELQHTRASQEDTLLDVARRFSLGQDEIVMANPDVDRWMPGAGTEVLLPKQFILPDAPRNGIVLNVPEMRLFFYRSHGKNMPGDIVTYPVSIGRMDWRTPIGTTRVLEKQVDPVWRPPETIKIEHAADGDILPDVVPAGPDNPLGRFAMRLGIPGYLIHGTGQDKAFGIGMRVTHGCVRMYPEDIEQLFPEVPVGTPVTIVNQPIKLGWKDGELYLEVHPPLDEDNMGYDPMLATTLDLIQKKMPPGSLTLDGRVVRHALEKPDGIPVVISRRNAAPAVPEEEEVEEPPPQRVPIPRY